MNTEELTDLVSKHNLSLAEINQALAHITRNILLLHDSIKSLEVTALAHDAQIDTLIESGKNLEKQWEAYINTLPRS